MDIGIYYHVLEIGLVFEKGKQRGKIWRINERMRLRDELSFWKKIINYIEIEESGIDCYEKFFSDLDNFVKKYDVENYKRILEMKNDIRMFSCINEYKNEDLTIINRFILRLLDDFNCELDKFGGKSNAFRIMRVMHNLPRVFHGKDILGGGDAISIEDAIEYAGWSMSKEMKEKYKSFIE